ncbi:von Willebrand domain-containing protein [Colletotrichum sp. SAR 10_77]|nr:von Willebrand domain-containing protein [Colletotrichum sp. SAR 10_77]
MQETAALLEEHTPEIFETMIGNIPAETNVSVQLEYIQEIKTSIFEDGGEVLEVIIPMSIAPRYADSEGVLNHAGTKMETDGLDVTVKVIDSKRIQKLHCNHYANIQENVPLVSTEVPSFSDLGTAKEKSAEESLTQTIATFTSDSAIMDEDFIANLEYARSYAKAIKADFGGTRLAFALKNAVDSRRAGEASAQIIVITDGEVEPESVLEYVWETRQDLGEKIRFFALGIGHNVPHRLIDRIGELLIPQPLSIPSHFDQPFYYLIFILERPRPILF